jgi:anti-anti-sigma factor
MVALPVSRSTIAPWGSVTCSAPPHPLRVALCGEVDIALEENLGAVLSFVAHSVPSDVAICLHDVTFLDSTGLDFLVELAESVRGRGYATRIVAPSTAVRWVLRIAGLADAFAVEPLAAESPDTCACRVPRIDGIAILVPNQRVPGADRSPGDSSEGLTG